MCAAPPYGTLYVPQSPVDELVQLIRVLPFAVSSSSVSQRQRELKWKNAPTIPFDIHFLEQLRRLTSELLDLPSQLLAEILVTLVGGVDRVFFAVEEGGQDLLHDSRAVKGPRLIVNERRGELQLEEIGVLQTPPQCCSACRPLHDCEQHFGCAVSTARLGQQLVELSCAGFGAHLIGEHTRVQLCHQAAMLP